MFKIILILVNLLTGQAAIGVSRESYLDEAACLAAIPERLAKSQAVLDERHGPDHLKIDANRCLSEEEIQHRENPV